MEDTQQTFKEAVRVVADQIESILLSLILFGSYALLIFTNANAVAGIVFILPMVAVSLTRELKDEYNNKYASFLHWGAMFVSMVIIVVLMYNGINGGNGVVYATVIYPIYELIYARIKWRQR